MSRIFALPVPVKLVMAAFTLSIALVGASLADPRGIRRLRKLETDLARQEAANRALREENIVLQKTVKLFSTPVNPVSLEKAAREELGFVRQDEVLFKFE